MIDKDLVIVIITGISLISTISIYMPGLTFAQPTGAQHAVQSGYKDGLSNSQADFDQGHVCNPTASGSHTVPYMKGYSVGYNSGPCGRNANSGPASSSGIPGLLPP